VVNCFNYELIYELVTNTNFTYQGFHYKRQQYSHPGVADNRNFNTR